MHDLLKNIDKYILYIFDVDGTLIESNLLHKESWEFAFNKFHIKYSPDFYNDIKGISSLDVAKKYVGLEQNYFDLCKCKQSYYQKIFNKIYIYKDIVSLLIEMKKKEKKIALCTGGSEISTKRVIDFLKINDFVDFYVCANSSIESKPSPNSYLEVLKHFNVLAQYAVAFEDSDNGIKAALNAGINVYKVKSGQIIGFVK